MKRYKATERFKELGIDNSYQGLHTDVYYMLLHGHAVELNEMPEHLTKGKYVEELKGAKNGN